MAERKSRRAVPEGQLSLEGLFEAGEQGEADTAKGASVAAPVAMPPAAAAVPGSPATGQWRSTLARLLAQIHERERSTTLDDELKDTLDVLSCAVEESARLGSVCTTPAEMTEIEPSVTPAHWGARLDRLVKAGLAADVPGYMVIEKNRAGRGRQNTPFTPMPPFVRDGEGEGARLYLTRFFEEELRLAGALARLAGKTFSLSATAQGAVKSVCSRSGCDAAQQAAIELALTHALSIVSGGPGTGKTRTVGVMLALMAILNASPDRALRFYLAAPTGKATGRLHESITGLLSDSTLAQELSVLSDPGKVKIVERTLHKWLVTPMPNGERPGPGNPLDCDVLVIDEASMMDTHLATRILSTVGGDTRVVVLGDKHQLAAVGPGSVFADISDATGPLSANTTMLTTSHRFRTGGLIDQVARRINQETGESVAENTRALVSMLGGPGGDDGTYRAQWHELPATLEAMDEKAQRDFRFYGLTPEELTWLDGYFENYWQPLLTLLNARSAQAYRDAYDPFIRAVLERRALCAQRDGAHSVSAINDYFTMRLLGQLQAAGFYDENASPEVGADGDGGRRSALPGDFPGRLLIVRQNHDLLGVFNGDVAVILPALDESGTPTDEWVADFMDGRRFRPVLLPRHETAFAMTIHQSQGSDFQEVGVFLPNPGVRRLASRELLYTGVTRTRGVVHLFGEERVLAQSMARSLERTSGLNARLGEILP